MPVREVKEKIVEEEKKKEKPKAHAPSHAKIRSIGNMMSSDAVGSECSVLKNEIIILCCCCCVGLEIDTPNLPPTKKITTAPQLGDKYNIKPPVLKRPRYWTLSVSLCIHAAGSLLPSVG